MTAVYTRTLCGIDVTHAEHTLATVLAWTRRVLRTFTAVIAATRRHVPAWLGAALTLALLIPGPIDELLVLVVIAGFAIAKPAMRADIAAAMRSEWVR